MERFTQDSFRRGKETREELPGINQKYLVIINPVSRGGKALDEGMWLLKQLRRLGVKHEAFVTEHPGHAEKIVKRWVERVDVAVAVGGDGTVNEVVNGMMAFPECEKTLAVFPAGTADDYCHNVGIPRDRRKALDVLLDGRDRKIDLIHFDDRYAVVTLGIGVDAEIAYKTLSHKRIRLLAYWGVGVKVVFRERLRRSPREVRIEGDSKAYDGKFLIAVFGNAPLYARYVYWMPDAKMDDGMLNLSALRPTAPISAWILLLKCFRREFKSDKVIYDQSKHYLVELKEESFIQIDGEVYKYNAGEKLEVSAVQEALRVRIPSEPEEYAPFINP